MTLAAERPARDGDEGVYEVRFDPIRQVRAHEYVAEQIRRHISLRLLAPGRALPPEREMARQFGVGRPTIQLALRLLEAERLLEVRRGRRGGTFVARVAEDEAAKDRLVARIVAQGSEPEELLAYRALLEPGVAEAAAEARRRDDLRVMRGTLRATAQSASEADYMRLDTEFHLALAAATGNRFFVEAIDGIRRGLNDVLSLLPESDVWHTRIDDEHEAIFDAVAERDAGAARAAMELHVSNSSRGVLAALAAVRRQAARRPYRRATMTGGTAP